MAISDNIRFLANLNVKKYSVELDANNLKPVEKRSTLKNFFSWVIYLITFTLVPRNSHLDQITRDILKDLGQQLNKAVTHDERTLFKKAIKNLLIVNKENGGSEIDATRNLLTAIKNIQILPAVQKLSKKQKPSEKIIEKLENPEILKEGESEKQKEEPPIIPQPILHIIEELDKNNPEEELPQEEINKAGKEIPQQEEVDEEAKAAIPELPYVPKKEEKTLSELLKNLMNQKADEVAEKLGPFLLQMKETEDLSKEEIKLFRHVLSNLSEEWIDDNAKKLSPKIISFMVQNSFQNKNMGCIPSLLEALTKKPANIENLTEFVYGFPIFADGKPAAALEDINSKILFNFIKKFEPPVIDFIKNNLSNGVIGIFIHSLFAYFVFQCENKNAKDLREFGVSRMIANWFGQEYEQLIINILCRIQSPTCLAGLLTVSKDEDEIVNAIFDLNPKMEDQDFFVKFADEIVKDCFFDPKALDNDIEVNRQFRLQILYARLPKLIELFKCVRQPWQGILIEKLPSACSALAFSHISKAVIKQISGAKLIHMYKASKSLKIKDIDKKILESIVEFFDKQNVNDLYEKEKDVCADLLPFLEMDNQIEVVSKILDHIDFNNELFEEAKKLPLEIWEAASKGQEIIYNHFYATLPPNILAAIANGQCKNKFFIGTFFNSYFTDEKPEETKMACLDELNPAIFEVESIYPLMEKQLLINFFNLFSKCLDKEHAQKLIESFVIGLFNGVGYANKSLPIEIFLEEIVKFDEEAKEKVMHMRLERFKKPEIRLLLACYTNRLDNKKIEAADEMDKDSIHDLFELLVPIVTKLKDKYRQRFLDWIQDLLQDNKLKDSKLAWERWILENPRGFTDEMMKKINPKRDKIGDID